MKKSTLFLIVFVIVNCKLAIINCKAQPNGGFENWSPEFTYENPDNWQTFNFLVLTSPPNQLSAFKATGINKHSGNYGLMLKSIFVTNNPNPELITDTIGLAFKGKIGLSPPSLKVGFPYSGRPEKLEFYSRYAPVGGDSGSGGVYLRKWNGLAHDTIGQGRISFSTTQYFTLFQVDITYSSSELPDSAVIFFSTSKDSTTARVGSILFVDDVALTGWVGIDKEDLYAEKVKIFPNPTKNDLTVMAQIDDADNVKVIDALGQSMGVYKIQNYNVLINTSLFTNGIYFYDICDKKDRILTKGKFNVAK